MVLAELVSPCIVPSSSCLSGGGRFCVWSAMCVPRLRATQDSKMAINQEDGQLKGSFKVKNDDDDDEDEEDEGDEDENGGDDDEAVDPDAPRKARPARPRLTWRSHDARTLTNTRAYACFGPTHMSARRGAVVLLGRTPTYSGQVRPEKAAAQGEGREQGQALAQQAARARAVATL